MIITSVEEADFIIAQTALSRDVYNAITELKDIHKRICFIVNVLQLHYDNAALNGCDSAELKPFLKRVSKTTPKMHKQVKKLMELLTQQKEVKK